MRNQALVRWLLWAAALWAVACSSPSAPKQPVCGGEGCSGGDVGEDAARDVGEDAELDADVDGPGDADTSPPEDVAPDVTDDGSPDVPVEVPPTDWSVFSGELLGANLLRSGEVEFSLFAPRASSVSVVGSFNDWQGDVDPLVKDEATGVWSRRVRIASPVGQSYEFLLDGERQVVDPYAKANWQLRGNSFIVDPSQVRLSDEDFERPPRHALVIYEMHVSDFTSHASSGVLADDRGRFAGVAQRLDHLQRLGVNAVELMPVAESQSDGYGWGYNPALLFAPESSLASSPGGVQVAEFAAMVDALHDAGIAVIVDVVYNHVWGQGEHNPLWEIDPLYYFDYDDDGDPENDSTPWGYKVATWRPMVQKLMYDNLRYWMDTYHVDGFRLDSTENVHLDAVAEVIRRLQADGYGDRYFIFEEFSVDHNARIRQHNAEAGQALISSWGTNYKYTMWNVLRQGAGHGDSLGTFTYYNRDEGWRSPAEVIHYATSHDEGTLTARIGATRAQVRVSAVHLLTALGVPMFWMGEEFARLHYGNYHPEGSSAALARENNEVDWADVEANGALVDFFGALVRLRTEHAALHNPDPGPADRTFYWIVNDWNSAIGYAFHHVAGDHDFVVLLNFRSEATTFDVDFPALGRWFVMVEGEQATSEAPGLRALDVSGATPVRVAPWSGMVLMSEAVRPR